jgi:hypothetical protein
MLTISSLEQTKTTTKTNMSDDDSVSAARRKIAKAAAPKVGAQKFTQKTKAYQRLKQLFEDKKIDPNDSPAEVRAKDPLFQDFTNQQFRSQFNKLKALFGTSTKDGESLIVERLYGCYVSMYKCTNFILSFDSLSQKVKG